MNVNIESLEVSYLELTKLDQVNSRFSILWIAFDISTHSNTGSSIISRNISTNQPQSLACTVALLLTRYNHQGVSTAEETAHFQFSYFENKSCSRPGK
jgi:hypothetical protein